MSWAVEWSPAAERDVLHMSWRLAARICHAVLVLAEQGVGNPERTDQAGVMRLRVRGGVVLFRRDLEARTLYVLRLYESRT